ncbi:hypothetical protein [Escherichia coli]|uniref:hypothetical protein n=1 Tax=Escherichia coli TaxID=562 RepID=UPI0039BED66E
MSTNNELLIRLARAAAKTMSLPDADIVNKLCTQLDCSLAATRVACGERTAAHSTLESAREVTSCPEGVDLQDHLKVLVAENLALKTFIYQSCYSYDGDGRDVCDSYIDAEESPFFPKTPATDGILREAEARGVEKLKEHLNEWMAVMNVPSDMRFEYSEFISACDEFATQLREGEA